MSINPNRAAARLAKTKEATNKQFERMAEIKNRLAVLAERDDARAAKRTNVWAKVSVMTEARAVAAAHVAGGIDVAVNEAQVAVATESINKYQVEIDTLDQATKDDAQTIEALEAELTALLHDPMVMRYYSQAAALARKEEAYPAKLKAHLRRCKNHGVADSRMAAARSK